MLYLIRGLQLNVSATVVVELVTYRISINSRMQPVTLVAKLATLPLVCKSKPKGPSQSRKHRNRTKDTHYLTTDEQTTRTPTSSSTEELSLFTVRGQPHTPIVIALAVNGKDLQMELDTGAAISIISKATEGSFVS